MAENVKDKKGKQSFLRLTCECGKVTYIHVGEFAVCSSCHRAVFFAWGIKRHQFLGMRELEVKP